MLKHRSVIVGEGSIQIKIKENHGPQIQGRGTSLYTLPLFVSLELIVRSNIASWGLFCSFFPFVATFYTLNFLICRMGLFTETVPRINKNEIFENISEEWRRNTLWGNPLKWHQLRNNDNKANIDNDIFKGRWVRYDAKTRFLPLHWYRDLDWGRMMSLWNGDCSHMDFIAWGAHDHSREFF